MIISSGGERIQNTIRRRKWGRIENQEASFRLGSTRIRDEKRKIPAELEKNHPGKVRYINMSWNNPQNLRPKMQSFRVLIDAQFLPRRARGLVYSSLHEIQVKMPVTGEFIVYFK